MSKLFLHRIFLGIFFLNVAMSGYAFPIDSQNSIPLIPRHVLFGNPEKTAVSISPNGKMLAYLAPCNGALNVWVKTLGQNDDHIVTHDKRGMRSFLWACDNEHILFVQDENGDENWHIFRTNVKTQETVDMTPYHGVRAYIHSIDKHFPNEILITMNKEDSKLFDVYLLHIESGALELVSKNPGHVDCWQQDSTLCVRAAVAVNPDESTALLVRDNTESPWIQKATWSFEDSLPGSVPARGSRPVSFSSDGNSLYLMDSTNANTQRLMKLNLLTDSKELLAEDELYDIHSVVINSDTYEPDLVSFQKDHTEWRAINPLFQKDLESIVKANKGDLQSIERSSDMMKWILCFVNDNMLNTYYLYDQQTKNLEFLFYDRPALSKYTLAGMKSISFQARDGLTIHGYLTLPQNKQQKNLPLVLYVHGGPWDRDTWGYNEFAQFLSNRGYACLQVNFRGSIGYGKQFINTGDREWAGKMHNDLIDAVAWAVKEQNCDPTKVAILGMSYGGYAALVGATFTPDVFCCAVDLWGPSNLITMVRSITSFREMGRAKWYRRVGNPETEESFLRSRSPLFKVDQIKIPIFIAQGGNDPRVLQSESEQIVQAMKSKGIPHEYMLFPNEGHGAFRPENAYKLCVAVEKFLAKHLGGRVEDARQAPMNVFDNVTLDVVYIPQNDRKSCATTSVAMAISYYEKLNEAPLDKETVWRISGADESTVRHFGNDMEGLKRIAAHYGYKSKFIDHMEISDIEQLLSEGILVMLNIMGSKQTSHNHAALVIGYDRISGVFYINDPADRQNRTLKYSDLESRWFAHLSSPMGPSRKSGFIIYPKNYNQEK